MGGLGSGRLGGYGSDTIDACRAILDVNQLHREGFIKPGRRGICYLMRDGEKVAAIGISSKSDVLLLFYQVRPCGGEWEAVTEAVRMVSLVCPFGGARPYFICPGKTNGIACGRRVAKLYGYSRYFLCRHCYHLTYACQSETALGRAERRSDKIRRQLGGAADANELFPPRPKGMWRRTYQRLCEKLSQAEKPIVENLWALVERFPDLRAAMTAQDDTTPQTCPMPETNGHGLRGSVTKAIRTA